jgi:hypothetical protein
MREQPYVHVDLYGKQTSTGSGGAHCIGQQAAQGWALAEHLLSIRDELELSLSMYRARSVCMKLSLSIC